MRDRHQIPHHFLLGGDLLRVEHQQLTPMLAAQMLQQLEPKARQPVLVGHDSIATSSATTESTRAVNLGRLKFRPPPIPSINSRLAIPLAMANSSTIRRWFFKSGRCAWDDTRQ